MRWTSWQVRLSLVELLSLVRSVGFLVGFLVGLLVGLLVDWLVAWLGLLVGLMVGLLVSLLVGCLVGWLVGWWVGFVPTNLGARSFFCSDVSFHDVVPCFRSMKTFHGFCSMFDPSWFRSMRFLQWFRSNIRSNIWLAVLFVFWFVYLSIGSW